MIAIKIGKWRTRYTDMGMDGEMGRRSRTAIEAESPKREERIIPVRSSLGWKLRSCFSPDML
jgi:hypothetical protein